MHSIITKENPKALSPGGIPIHCEKDFENEFTHN